MLPDGGSESRTAALTSMLALKVHRHLERAWWTLEVTVEEGLRELEQLCVFEQGSQDP